MRLRILEADSLTQPLADFSENFQTLQVKFFNIFLMEKTSSQSIVYLFQMVGTGFLAFFVAFVIDKRNKIPVWIRPLYFGIALMVIGTSFGYNVGYPINPARDFGPRLFTFFVYGPEVFTYVFY